MTASPTVIIPTRQAEAHLDQILSTLLAGTIRPHIWLVDSSSTDRTIPIAKKYDISILSLSQSKYNHGLTREWARKATGGEIVVFLTQDAIPNKETIYHLIKPLAAKQAVISYGRQIPFPEAHPIEHFFRETYYPNQSTLRSLQDLPFLGAKTFFCSNACAAYVNGALDEIGGFSETLFGEDTVAAAKLLHAGYAVAYEAKATVVHSHTLSLAAHFRRSFDIGYSREKNARWFSHYDKAEAKVFAKALLGKIGKNDPLKLPYAFAYLLARGMGFFLGKRSVNASSAWCRRFSSSAWYWDQFDNSH